jgi:hypothetical protein
MRIAVLCVPFLCVPLLLAGCSTAYLPAGSSTGSTSETRLAADSYQISARTGSTEHAAQMLELRAAELTLKSGYQKFVVVDRAVTSTPVTAKGKMTIRMLKEADAGVKAVDASAVRARLHPLLIGVAGG